MSGEERASPEVDGNDDQDGTPGGPSHIELIRAIDRTEHISPYDTEKEVDFTVRNTSNREFNYIFLPLREFRRNLEVWDEDGTLLNIFPNSYVEKLLAALKEEKPEEYRAFQHRFKHSAYKLFIQLPPDRPLKPGDLRTIRLTFEQSDAPEFHSVSEPSLLRGWFKNWRNKFFRIPEFFVSVERFPGHPHDIMVVVDGTPGYAARGEEEVTGGEPGKEIHRNGLNDDTRILTFRIPPADKKRFEWKVQYDLIPSHESLMASLVVYWWIAVIVGLGSGAISLIDAPSYFVTPGRAISAGFATATLGIIFALQENWSDRYRILSILPLLLNAVTWVLWTSQFPSGTG